MFRILGALLAGLSLVATAAADEPLKKELDDTLVASHWFYNDLEMATGLAKTTGKPLLVMFRCVPCACATALDESITRKQSASLELQQKFVCVRVVHMRGVDLERFQFDYDVSLVAIFMNADGTIYGRYGTRASLDRKADTHVSHAAFTKAMQKALALHADRFNKRELAGKQPQKISFRRPEDSAYLAKQAKGDVSEKNCIHCHMVGESLLHEKLKVGLEARDIWRFPLPENLDMTIDREDGLKIKSVRDNGRAKEAGLRAGDELVSANGQPLISIADLQWVLHHAADESELKLNVDRAGKQVEVTIPLSGNWRKSDVVWRASLHSIRPYFHLRNEQGGKMMVYYPTGAATKAGLRNGDVIQAVDDNPATMREGDFLDYLYLQGKPKQSVKLKVTGKTGEREIMLPIETPQESSF